MNKNVLIIMGGALIVAIVAALLVQKQFTPETDEAGAVPTVQVLVADESISVGEEVTAEKVRWQDWPEEGVFRGAIIRSEQEDEENLEIYGRKARRAIDTGEAISEKAIIPDSEAATNFLAAALEPGMRAYAIEVEAETMVGGFVRPGDRVDVIMTYQVRLRGDTEENSRKTVARYASQTVLDNIRVLAVDQEAKEDEEEPKIAKTITLEVDQAGAEILALATEMGELSLALRRLGDQDKKLGILTTDVQVSNVLQRVNKIQDTMSVNTNTIRVYSGSQVQNVPVRTVPSR